MFCRPGLTRPHKTGFSTLEYALLVTAIVIGLLAAQTYLTRAVSYKWRDASDAFGSGRQLKADGAGSTVIIRTEHGE